MGGLVDRKLEPDRRLSSEAERNWAEISTGQLRFDRRREEARALENIREGDLLRFFDRCVGEHVCQQACRGTPKRGQAFRKA